LQVVGYLLLVLSFFTAGFQFTFEEKLLARYHLEPIQMVGLEGLFGLGLTLLILPILTFAPCDFGRSACVVTATGESFLERPEVYLEEVGQNGLLLFFSIFCVFSVTTFNVSGVSVTQSLGALTRVVCDVVRTLIIWVVGVVVTLTAGEEADNYKWESTDGRVIALQLFAFAVLVVGNLLYSAVYLPPCLREPVPELSEVKINVLLPKSANRNEIDSSIGI
jgi:hypothetical protein